MKESLLQFIWQYQHFNKNALTATNGDVLQVIHTGTLNRNQGPDFLNARVKINQTSWAGNIELHINSSDWNLHKHSADHNFTNIVLHVVWLHNQEITDIRGNVLPTLELHNRVSKILLTRYEELMMSPYFIPCERQINQVNQVVVNTWKQRLLVERLEKKVAQIFQHLTENNTHWEETFWCSMAGSFGVKVNMEPFARIARSIPLTIVAKYKNQVHQLEALLFGQAGLLEKKFADDYPCQLQKEFRFLKTKYNLTGLQQPLFFLRMRPAGFPTIRIAQLAMLIHLSNHLFAQIKETEDLAEIKKLLDVTATEYWNNHYVFDDSSVFVVKKLGAQMINSILVNTVIPVLFAYGQYHKETQYKERAMNWLEKIAPEKNVVTRGFESLKINSKNSFDSQSLIQLKNEYCSKKRCLECAIGNAIFSLSPA